MAEINEIAANAGYSKKIVIDEAEAAADIKNIKNAIAKLAEARALLNPGRLNDSLMLGSVRTALGGKLDEFNANYLKKFERECEETCDMINAAVRKYRRIDRELAGRVQGDGDGRDDD
jgi:tRNA(Ser,Leu) C12 N-acetylase TAN1